MILKRIIAMACIMYTAINLSVVPNAVSIRDLGLSFSLSFIFGAILSGWVAYGIKD